ncbi:MAG TPA: hypothetical protein VFM57_01025 [Thermoleophilaceae bacterium]|nr:hypothetical protein [Thermoleophilaceae bacterium]
MPSSVYSVPNPVARIRMRVRRGGLDRQLAEGADPASSAELERRATQLLSTAERSRIANSLIEALGDARRAEPVTLRTRPQRAVVRDAADDIGALVLRLRDERVVAPRGLALAARLADDGTSPMHRHDVGDLHEAVGSALSALDATGEAAGDLQAQAA